jgi:hypothetical protein
MRNRLIGVLCFALLGALVIFYADQIYQSSLTPPQQPHGRTNGPGAYETQKESVQDISAETVAYYTKVLAGFTGVLALVSCLQIWLLAQGARAGREQAAEMKRASGLTETQNAIISRQTDIQERQQGLAHAQFIVDKRPRLHVRHVAVEIPLAVDPNKITGSLIVVNRGGTETQITDSFYRIYINSVGLPMLPPFGDHLSQPLHKPGDGPLIAGASRRYEIVATEVLTDAYRHNINERGIKLYVMGQIKFADVKGNERFMGFCRVYEPPTVTGGNSWFSAVDHPDYEYED